MSNTFHIWYYESDWPNPSINITIDVPSTTTVDELKEIFRGKIPSVSKGSTEIQATYFTQVRANTTQENKKLLGWTFANNGTPTYDGTVPLTKYPFWNMKGTRISFTIAPALPKQYYTKQPTRNIPSTSYRSTTNNTANNTNDEEYSFPYEAAPGAGQNSRRRNRNRNRNRSRQAPQEENSEEEKCRTFLKSKGIESLADFRKKSVQLHPNKGGDEEEYKKISGCVDTLFKKKNGGARKSRRSRTKNHRKQKTRKQ